MESSSEIPSFSPISMASSEAILVIFPIEIAVSEFLLRRTTEAMDLTRFNTNLIPHLIFDMDNQALCAKPTMQEVKEAVYAIDKDSVMAYNCEGSLDCCKRFLLQIFFVEGVNGHLVGYFKSAIGLRQSDSISPLLFILAAKYLSRGCSLNISHLAYADEIMIFTNGSKSALEKVLGFLQEYEQASGQKISQQQSCFITAPSVTNSRRQIIAQSRGFHHKTLLVTYLGVLFYKGPKKTLLFDSLLSKIRDRISGWENKVLLPGGCITLIRSVLSSLPIYLLQVLKPSGDSLDSKQKHWTSWNKVTFPSSEGGLDIRSL
ncbi:Reverse transcriptase domain - like 10 [Theobroma cacao]|nr:Reverse transcriptase domain - like 10 [Theobroma cacao]